MQLENQAIYYAGTQSSGHATVREICLHGELITGEIGNHPDLPGRPVIAYAPVFDEQGALLSAEWSTLEERP